MPWWGWLLLAWPLLLAPALGLLLGAMVRLADRRRNRPVSYVLEDDEVRGPLAP